MDLKNILSNKFGNFSAILQNRSNIKPKNRNIINDQKPPNKVQNSPNIENALELYFTVNKSLFEGI